MSGQRRRAWRVPFAWVVFFHEALACFVAQDAAFPRTASVTRCLDAGRPNHPVDELDEFHVHELGAGFVGESHAVARVFPGVGSDAPGLADATGGDDDGLGFENDEAASLAPIGKAPATRPRQSKAE